MPCSVRLRRFGAWAFALACCALAPPAAVDAAPSLASARDALERGAYEQALALAGARRERDATLVAAAAERALGRLGAARARIERATVKAPKDLALRAALAELAEAEGDRETVATLVDLTDDEREPAGKATPIAADAVARARLARAAGRWKEANALLRSAVKAAPKLLEAHVLWGELLLAKHSVDDAEASLRAALALDARDPDAHALLARLNLEERYDRDATEQHLAAALARNPRHPGALGLRGQIALDAEDFPAVERVIAELRRTDAQSPEASRLAGAAALLLDRPAEWARERDARLARHPADGELFFRVAEALVRQRRYREAEAVAREGVARDPAHAGCLASLGTSLLRRGEEAEGTAALRRAFDRDPYDVRTYNLLELYDRVIPTSYVTVESRRLRFRVQPRDRAVIEAVVAPFLERVYDGYVARYGFAPQGKIMIELYADPAHYAVRTVGLPVLDVAGVCFGRVITSQSPSNERHAWGLVLAHELAHVFALELSGGRVPRWFTEGLAELETTRLPSPAPVYRRRAELVHYGAFARGELPKLAELSRAFVEARDASALVAAYAHAAAAIEIIEARVGFARIREALVAYGRGERTPAVLARIAGGVDLDAVVRDALTSKFAGFERQFLPLRTGHLPVDRARAVAASADAPDEERARAAVALVTAGELDRAEEALAHATAGASPELAFAHGELALARGNAAPAIAALEPLVAGGHDGYDVRVALALASLRLRDRDAAERHLRRATALAPDEIEAHALLGELLADARGEAAAYPERVTAFRLDPQSAALGRTLVQQARAAKRPDDVAALAPALIFIAPADATAHAAYADALAALGRSGDARAARATAQTLRASVDAGSP
jgi:predicted Zn-dependent protease